VQQSDRQTDANGDDHASPGEALREAIAQLGELREYAVHYLSARVDSLKVSLRNVTLAVALAAGMLFAALAIVVTAIVLVCVGLAQMLAACLGGRMWAGNLIVGIVVILAVVIFIWFLMNKMFATSFAKTKQRYERKLRRERVEHGHDAQERSIEAEHAEHD
jgi:uncharacterized membrane protein YqjE